MTKVAEVVPFQGKSSETEEGFDPGLYVLRDDQIPTIKLETATARVRRKARDRLYVPRTVWREIALVVASGVSGRAVGLWLAVCMQAKIEDQPWVRVSTHLKESLGFNSRKAHSRAVQELEKAGFLEVQRRPGYAPRVRLISQRTGEGEDDV
jgi:hypothetical protein